MKRYVGRVEFYPARTVEVVVDVESVVVWGVVSVHGSDLGKAAKNFRIICKLVEDFARFGIGGVQRHFSECSRWAVGRKILSPLF